MGATWNPDVLVNLFGSAQAVQRKSFGLVCWATAAVEAGFSEVYKIYESNADAQADADLSTGTKAALAAFYSQPVHPTRVLVAKVAYATLAADLTTLIAATPAADTPYIFACADRTKAHQNALADWTLANGMLAMVQSEDADILTDTAGNLFETLHDDTNGRAAGIWHEADEYADLCWASAGAALNPDDKSGVWYDKTLVGCNVSDGVDATEKGKVVGNYGNLYLPLLGVGATGEGKLFDGKWIDELITTDWLRARIQEAVAQYKLDVSARGDRIPYTNPGLAQLEAAIRGPCDKGVNVGHLQSYVISTPDIADVLVADITARRCTIPVTAVLSGGIRTITINVGVVNA